MLSTLRWAGAAANANNLEDPNTTFDPTLPCSSGEEVARDALVLTDVPAKLIERLQKKPQEMSPSCSHENAESTLRFYEEDITVSCMWLSRGSRTSGCTNYYRGVRRTMRAGPLT